MSNYTSGKFYASSMTIGKKNWAALHSGKHEINIVRRGPDVIAAVWCGDDGDGEEQANARLFAAAPDLIDALHSIAKIGIHEIHDWEAVAARMQKTALAAIAKATDQS